MKKGFISIEWVIIGSLVITVCIYLVLNVLPQRFSQATDAGTNQIVQFDNVPAGYEAGRAAAH